MKNKKNRKIIIKIVIIILLIVVPFVTYLSVCIYRNKIFHFYYDAAWERIMNSKYYNAENCIEMCRKNTEEFDSKDFEMSMNFTEDMIDMMKLYEAGKYKFAYQKLAGWYYKDEYIKTKIMDRVILSEEQKAFIDEKAEMVVNKYNEILPELEEADRKARIEMQKKAEEEAKKAKKAKKSDTGDSKQKNSGNSGYKKTGSEKKESSTIDPSDYDIEQYYEDYKDEFEDEDDAWDDFEDNEEYWDDY